jgi:lysophospholipase L1-like esterase
MFDSQTMAVTTFGRFFKGAVALASALVVVLSGAAAAADSNVHWVCTWGCGPQLTERHNLPPVPMANSTLRQFVPVTLGGKQLRVRFSNAYGTNPVTMRSVRVALASGKGSAGNGDIQPPTDTALAFDGKPHAVIPPGEMVLSDPFTFDLSALTNLAISICFGDISATTISGHPGSRTTSFIQQGDALSAPSLSAAAKTAHWYIITGVDVLTSVSHGAVVVLGDSITDGRGSTTDGNNRWPDNLARRLHTNAPTASVAVVNQGIGGNAVLSGGLGPTALDRFDADVLNTSGARWLIVFEGVNDIGGSRSLSVATNLIAAYNKFIDKAHARGLRVYGATITPFGGSFYDAPGREQARQTVNDWIRSSGRFDAVIDFDLAVRDPANSSKLLPAYESGDHLHLSVAGYQRMADVIDLSLFTP